MKKINLIDLWSQDNTPENILVPALYDECLDDVPQLYNKVRVYKNADVSYFINGKLENAYHHVILLIKDEEPVRVIFLRDCDLDMVVHDVFSGDAANRMIAESTSNEYLKQARSLLSYKEQGKLIIDDHVDLAQKTHAIKCKEQLGSINRIQLIAPMLGGSMMATGEGESIEISSKLIFDKTDIVIKANLGDFEIEIKHKSVFKFMITDDKGNLVIDASGTPQINNIRWLILQDA